MSHCSTESHTVDGVRVEITQGGTGKPLLFLHGLDTGRLDRPFLDRVATEYSVVAPWHPGFGHSELPTEFGTVGDLAFFYLQLVKHFDIDDAVLVGSSFGGWLAAEIAVRTTAVFSHLVLLDPVGIKIGEREDRDITDIYSVAGDDLNRLLYHDPRRGVLDVADMSDDELLGIARGREAHAYFGWRPYLHNPSLRRWLRRIDIPTLVLWGASDGIVRTDYGRVFAGEVPDAEFQVIAEAGHYPHREQSDRVAAAITRFAGAGSPNGASRPGSFAATS